MAAAVSCRMSLSRSTPRATRIITAASWLPAGEPHRMNYLDRHRAELNKKYPKFAQYKQNFNVTDDIMQELVTLAKDDKIEFNEEQYNRSKPLIMLQIKALIARDLYDMAEYFQVINDDNESFQEALRLINDEQRYKKELGR